MAGSVLEALLKAGIVSKEETPKAKRDMEQLLRREAEQISEEAAASVDGPAFDAPARTVAMIPDAAASLTIKDELTQEMKDWFGDSERDVDAMLASGKVTPEMIKK